ncbi:MAG: DUF4919 domain-containing protein [Muribaculaceae bacterium]
MRIAHLILSCLLVWACCLAEERQLFPINWEIIEKTVTENPDSVKKLALRMTDTSKKIDLTWDERRLAVYGQSILTENKDDALVVDANKAFSEGKYSEAITLAHKVLDVNPLNLKALNVVEYSIWKLMEAGDTITYTKAQAMEYSLRAFRIYNTIATTGDGSMQHPFYVTCVSDEYLFMRFYLNLWKYKGQKLVGMCDVFTLAEASEYYDSETIVFDTSRSLMLLMKAFKETKDSD